MSVNQTAEIDRVDQELAAAMGARPRDPAACISALEKAIALARSHSGAADVFYLPELLDELSELYDQVGRVDDALAAMRQALVEGWSGQPDGRCRLAEILMRGGRVAEAEPIWAQVRADTPEDVWVFNNAGFEYGAIGDHVTALAWLTDGLALALDSGDPERLVGQLLDLRAASLAALDRVPDELQARAEVFLAAEKMRRARAVPASRVPSLPGHVTRIGLPQAEPVQPTPAQVAWAWFPAGEFEQALARWPELTEPGGPAAGGRDHAGYCLALQDKLREASDAGVMGVRIAPIRLAAFLFWCDEHGEDPGQARARYAADLARQQVPELIVWPPGRNEPCWCGSGRKYKKCCAAPGAAAHG